MGIDNISYISSSILKTGGLYEKYYNIYRLYFFVNFNSIY